jgi:hypothetical protein
MLPKGGSIMPRFINQILTALTVLVCIITLVSCGSSGPAAPGEIQTNEPDPPYTPTDVNNDDDEIDNVAPDPEDNTIIPSDEITTEGISSLGTALQFLKESGGGVLTTPLQPDAFAIHVWDLDTGGILEAQAIVKCSGGPTSLVDISGPSLFENASFPLTVTVYSPGRALSTYVETSANVLSFPMSKIHDQIEESFIFGVSESLGYELMEFYSDDLLTEIYYETPSLLEPGFIPFEIAVEPMESFGFSAFLFGNLQAGEVGDEHTYVTLSPIFWMTNHFAWNIEPLYPGDHIFYGITFDAKPPPDGVATGDAVVPLTVQEMDDILEFGRMMAIPTCIFIEEEKYLAIGPGIIFNGDEPDKLSYRCPWFVPAEPFDRVVISGQLVNPDGAVNILHSNWHFDSVAPVLEFSGFASIGIQGGFAGISLPGFVLTDPMPGASDLYRITARADEVGPVWFITTASDTILIDTADYSVPLTWVSEVYSDFTIQYQVEMVDALSQNIDDFNEDQIIMTREEISLSPWTEPTL